jgi:autotransporter-associated beta strand protein
MYKTRFSIFSIAIAAALLICASVQAQETWTWLGGTDDVADAANWSLSNPSSLAGPPGVTAGSQTGLIASFAGVGSTTLTQNDANYWLAQFIYQPGAQAYTYTATDPAGYLSVYPDAAGENAIDNQSTSLQIINIPSTGTFGFRGFINSTAGGGDVVVNAPVSVGDGSTSSASYAGATGSGNIYFNVDTSVHPNGNVNGGTWTSATVNTNAYANSRARFFVDGLSGRVYLGNIGTAYRGTFNLDSTAGGKVQLTNDHSLGDEGGGSFGGSGTGPTAVFIYGGAADADPASGYNTTLELSNNISVTRGVLYLGPRAGATIGNTPHISNVSGNNTLTVGYDWNTMGLNSRTDTPIDGNWNIESQAGKLTIAGGPVYNTAGVNVNLQLMGDGDGEVSSQITFYQDNPNLNVIKMGNGTWTFSNLNNDYTGTTTIDAGVISVTGAYTGGGAWTVNSGGMLSGTGSVNAPVTLFGTLAPGTSPGTLTVNNSFTIGSGSVFSYELSTPGDTTDDQLTILGDLGFLGGTNTLNVNKIGGGNLTPGDYLLADATSLSGMLPTTTINAPLAAGSVASIFVDFAGSDVYLRVQAVPEPCTLGLICMGLLGLTGVFRHRRM